MRVTEQRWTARSVPGHAEETEIPTLARHLGVPSLVARLLWSRGLEDADRARSFLAPRLKELSSPAGLPDMDRAAARIAHAIRTSEPIGVYGDYDVDGMTSTALLVRFLRCAGNDPLWAIPDRSADAYGLTPAAVDRLAERGARLLVTVDNGVMAHEAVDHASRRGLDVIVTDHHLPSDTLPDALAVVDPHRRDANGEGRDLCGCALAFKTAWAVADRLRGLPRVDPARLRAFLRDAVGLVALATVADIVPLRGENRIFVSAGLASLRSSLHPGIRALLEGSRVGKQPLTTEDVAFRIAPRLNAAGRLSQPEMVIELLTANETEAARRIARSLSNANAERRRIEQLVLTEAAAQAEAALASEDRRSLVVHGEGWHRGVIGIVASRLVDRHHRPTVVIGFEGDGGRGSCRAPGVVDLHAALTDCDAHLDRYGGHAAAAGLEIDRGAVSSFTEAFEAAVRTQAGDGRPVRTIEYDDETSTDDWNIETVDAVERLAPFGPGNPQPLFLVRGAAVAGRPRLMGRNDAHLAFTLKQSGGAIRVVGFRQASRYDLVRSGSALDLIVAPMTNEWRGVRTAELRLVDMREAAS